MKLNFSPFYPTRLKFAEMELVCRLYQERWRSIKLATLWKYDLQLGSWAKFSKLMEVINLKKWRPFQYAANLPWLFRRAEWRNEHGSVRLQSGNCWWWEGNIYLTRLSSGGCPIGEELVLIMSNSRHPQTLQVSFPQFSVDFHYKIDSCSAVTMWIKLFKSAQVIEDEIWIDILHFGSLNTYSKNYLA